MCLANQNISRKTRVFLALGNLCLFAGLSIPRVAQHLGTWYHFVAGFLMGLSITFLLAAALRSRRKSAC